MADKEWIEKVKQIEDPREMLKLIVENETFLGFDPYYKDLRNAMISQAEKIINNKENKDG